MSTEDEYTPTTEEVRADHARSLTYPKFVSPIRARQFDRWLAGLLEGERARARTEALREAAERITREAPADECAMHLVMRVAELPYLSRVMLNGVTRSAERLRAMAGDIERGTNHTDRSTR
tara:strand:+ start:2456 stop:2818 length:363 start_codon:yes stop_codon:yes gene_type:complete